MDMCYIPNQHYTQLYRGGVPKCFHIERGDSLWRMDLKKAITVIHVRDIRGLADLIEWQKG